MKKKFSLLLAVTLIPLTGCNNANQGEEFVDMQNRTVKVDTSKTDRVICLGAGALRFYSYVGDVSKLVAVEEIDKTPFGVGTALRPYYHVNKDLFATLPTCGKGGPQNQAPEYEAIIANKPNIIVSFYSDPAVNDEISTRLGIPVIALVQGQDGIFDSTTIKSLELLGKVFKAEEKANKLVSYINSAKEELAKLNQSEDKYYAGCIGNWGKTNLYGSYKNFPVFEYAKVGNSVDSLSDLAAHKQVTIDAEKLVEFNPSKLFVDGAGFSGFIADYKANPEKYNALDAIKNGEVYSLLPYNAYYTNLEIQMISTYYVASVAHPDAFENFNIETKANEVTKAFLGKEIYNEMKEYSTALGGYQKLDLQELSK